MPSASTTSLKLDPETKDRIQRLADSRRRTSHWIMREAIEEYVSREEKRQSFHDDALNAWQHYQETGLHLSSEEADSWMDQLEAGNVVPTPKCHA